MRRVRKGKIIACLDIGSSSLICIIATLINDGEVRVLGHSIKESKGISGGAISDMKLAQKSIISVVSDAEKMANVNIDKLLVCVSGSIIKSNRIEESIKIASGSVKSSDISNLANKVRSNFRKNNREMIHLIPMQYRIDESMPVQNPRLMSGDRLYAKFHAISTSRTNILNIENCLKSCHISVNSYIIDPYASFLSCSTLIEDGAGSLVINIGADVTSFAILIDNKIIYSGGFVMAGNHITRDISTIVGVSNNYAEKIKTLNSNLILSKSSNKESIKYRITNQDESKILKMTKGDLKEIIRCRLEEIFELIKKSIKDSEIPDFSFSEIYLTGGSSNIIGVDSLCSEIFEKPTRLASPVDISNLTNYDDINKPEFSSALGMIMFVRNLMVKDKIKSSFEYSESGWFKKLISKILDI